MTSGSFCTTLVVQWKSTGGSRASTTHATRAIYAFERGQLYTLAPRSWEVWEPTRESDHYMKLPEFDATLLRLESGCGSAN